MDHRAYADIQVKRREAWHVEAGQPHRANNSYPKRMRLLLEGVFDADPFAVHIYRLSGRKQRSKRTYFPHRGDGLLGKPS